MKNFVFIPLTFLFFCLYSNQVLSWGMTGHRVVGEIASLHINKKAEEKIRSIIGHQTLAQVSNWMDDIKSDKSRDSLKPWHYVTIPDGKTYEKSEKSSKGDVIYGINYVVNKLKKGNLDPTVESEYLKILVHLVGDIHQPLHVGKEGDRGGNEVKVDWFWGSSNLHRVWDSGIIDSKKYSYTELTSIINHTTKEQVNNWQNSSVTDWAHEAMQYRKQIYDLPRDNKIDYDYRYKNWGTLKLQLLKGGVRLAGLLNEIYG